MFNDARLCLDNIPAYQEGLTQFCASQTKGTFDDSQAEFNMMSICKSYVEIELCDREISRESESLGGNSELMTIGRGWVGKGLIRH